MEAARDKASRLIQRRTSMTAVVNVEGECGKRDQSDGATDLIIDK